jgi:hypothetical protein
MLNFLLTLLPPGVIVRAALDEASCWSGGRPPGPRSGGVVVASRRSSKVPVNPVEFDAWNDIKRRTILKLLIACAAPEREKGREDEHRFRP